MNEFGNQLAHTKFLGHTLYSLALAIAVVLISILLAKVVANCLRYLLRKFRFHGQPYGAVIASQCKHLFPLISPLIGVYIALFGVLHISENNKRIYLVILSSFSVILATTFLCQVVRAVLRQLHRRQMLAGLNETVERFYVEVIQIFLWILAVASILSFLGINVAGIITGLGIGGLAISLAAKDTLSNLLAGIAIMSSHAFEIGDTISCSGVEGTVEYIGFRITKIREYDQMLTLVPNGMLANNPVKNLSQLNKRRIRLEFAIEFNQRLQASDLNELCQEIADHIAENDKLGEGKAVVCPSDIISGGIKLLVNYYRTDADYSRATKVKAELITSICDCLHKREITLLKQQVISS